MNRRANDALYFSDEIIRKVFEHRPLSLADVIGMLFPRETNRKQFECALRFLQELEKRGTLLNTEARLLFDSPNERINLTCRIIPKLRKFGIIESDYKICKKKYSLYFGDKFSLLLREMGLDLYGFSARHVNERKQLERNTN